MKKFEINWYTTGIAILIILIVLAFNTFSAVVSFYLVGVLLLWTIRPLFIKRKKG